MSHLLFLIVLGITLPAQSQVKAWEGSIDLPTYAWEDDPYPEFWALDGKIVYPYTMQEIISTTHEMKTYKALFLENDFLKVTCLPELGGRIFSVLNKITGKEMFHRNNVVKPGLIGMRGAWISGGIEWNTGPHGHTVTAISPVNGLVKENHDGSATLHISNTEHIFRTRWNVDLTLYPDRSYLHEEIKISNPQEGIHPYYFWNCTAFPCGAGTRFIFPMTLGCDHNGEEFFDWPIHDGKDISWLKNYDRPTSIFAWECDQDFFGCYDVDLDKGLVQVADHRVLKGKKAWTWGQSDDGLVSQEAITDEDGPYIEVQSGPLLTQADYGELFPHDDVSWEEWWYPVYGFEQGFDFATQDVVFEVVNDDRGDIESVNILSTKDYRDCQLRFASVKGGEQSFETDLTPKEVRTFTLAGDHGAEGKFTLLRSNEELIAEFEYPLPLTKVEAPVAEEQKDEEEMSVEELFSEALENDRETSRKRARELYERVILEATNHAEASFRLGVLDIEAGLQTEAQSQFESTLEIEPDHFMAHYFLGVTDFRSGNYTEVLRRADRLIELDPNSSLGYDLKGRAVMRLGRRQQVIPLFEKAAQVNPRDSRAWEHLAMAFFGAGRNSDAFALAKDLQSQDPTALIPRAILACEDPTLPREMFDEAFSFLGAPDFEFLEAQIAFEEMGMPRVAYLFAMPLMVDRYIQSFPTSPVQYFFAAAIALIGSSQQTAESLFEKLGDWKVDYVFPSRPETVPILEVIRKFRPDDGRIALLRGNVLANLGRISEATAEWEKAIQQRPDLAQAHRNLGLCYWKEKEDLSRAEAFYRRAIALRPSDQPLYAELSSLLSDQPEEVVELLTELGPENFRLNDLSEDLAAAYNKLGEYSKTIDFLGDTRFSNWESRKTSRNLWVKALMERGKKSYEEERFDEALQDFRMSLKYPRNLGVGRPAEPNESESYYWIGLTCRNLGKNEESKAAFVRGSAGNWGGESEEEFREQCRNELKRS